VDEVRIPSAGDPFTSTAPSVPTGVDQEEPPHGCYGSVVYIGQLVEGGAGEEVEVYEATKCRRCEREKRGDH